LLLTVDNTPPTLVDIRHEVTMTHPRAELLQGTLDMLILKVLALGPLHGWAISQRIQQVTREVLQVNQGSLYPSLHRLERQGWIAAAWGVTDGNRRAKFYSLTRRGQAQLERETAEWVRVAGAVRRVLDLA
jgi:transcriptional regulator